MNNYMPNYYVDFQSSRTILLTGCVHGNEPASEYFLKDFATALIAGDCFVVDFQDLYKFNYHIFPRVCDTGFRFDSEMMDINRGFPSGHRARLLNKAMYEEYYASIDCHETLPGEIANTGFYLYELGGLGISDHVNNAIGAHGYNRNNEINTTHPSVGSVDEYCFRRKNCMASFTLETHTSHPLDVRGEQQKIATIAIIRQLAKGLI